MNTLKIPFPAATASTQDEKVVVDFEDIITVEQASATKTIVYISNSSFGRIELTHSSAANGQMGDAINKTILNSNYGNSVVTMPSGVSISAVSYN